MNLKSIFAAAAGVVVLGSPAMGQIFSTSSPGGNAGSPAGTYGFTFVVDTGANLSMTQVGLFDYGIYGTGIGTISLFQDGSNTPVFTTTINLDTEGSGAYNYIMKSITPVQLTAGFEYALVWQNNLGESIQPYANGGVTTDLTGPYSKITTTHIYNRTGAAPQPNPLNDIGALSTYSTPYASVNFTLVENAVVPEPSAYAAIAGLGLVGFAAYRKFRR